MVTLDFPILPIIPVLHFQAFELCSCNPLIYYLDTGLRIKWLISLWEAYVHRNGSVECVVSYSGNIIRGTGRFCNSILMVNRLQKNYKTFRVILLYIRLICTAVYPSPVPPPNLPCYCRATRVSLIAPSKK
jgi:hypothetical protein